MMKVVSYLSEFRTEHVKLPVYAVKTWLLSYHQVFDDVDKVMHLLMSTLHHLSN